MIPNECDEPEAHDVPNAACAENSPDWLAPEVSDTCDGFDSLDSPDT